MEHMIEVNNLTKLFGGITAVEDLSFNIKRGEIMGIIGPNGAGKTTVFNLITGVYQPTQGSIRFNGEDITCLQPDQIVRKGIARTFQNIRLFRNLTALDNVVTALDLNHPMYTLGEALLLNIPFVNGKIKRCEKQLREKGRYFLELVGIEHLADAKASSLPYGFQRKLEIARALALEPKLLLLDEPAAGMNPEETMELARLIKCIQMKLDLTVFLIEHHMACVMELCDHILVVNFGRKLAEGNAEEIQCNPAVLKAYLGEGYKGA